MRNNYRDDGCVWFDDQICELADLLLGTEGIKFIYLRRHDRTWIRRIGDDDMKYAVMSMRPVAYLYSLRSIVRPFAANFSLMEFRRPRQMGNIMAAVAVLLTQPEQRAAARPMARKILLGFDPTQDLDRSQ